MPPILKADLIDLLRRTNDPNWIDPLLADPDSAAVWAGLLACGEYMSARLQADCDAATISLAPGVRPATAVLTLVRTASGIGGVIPAGYLFQDSRGILVASQTPITVPSGALTVTVAVQSLRQTELANTIADPGFVLAPTGNPPVLDTGGTNALISLSPAPGGYPPVVSTTFTTVQSSTPLDLGASDYLAAHGRERGQQRQSNEPDGLYRTRVRNVQDAVSPIALSQGVGGAAQAKGLPTILLREPFNDLASSGLKIAYGLDFFDTIFFEDGVHNTDFLDDAGVVPYRELDRSPRYFRLELRSPTTDPVTGGQLFETGSTEYALSGSPAGWPDVNTRPSVISALMAVVEEANRKRAGGVSFDFYAAGPAKYQASGASASASNTIVWTASPPAGRVWYLADGLFGVDGSSLPATVALSLVFTFVDTTTFTTPDFIGRWTSRITTQNSSGAFHKQIARIDGRVRSDGTHSANMVGQFWVNELR
jgi:hypothetical protein